MLKLIILFMCVEGIFGGFIYAQTINPDRQWFMYRGNYANGILDNASLPLNWDTEKGENIAWKTLIPGLGHSCPVVWGGLCLCNICCK